MFMEENKVGGRCKLDPGLESTRFQSLIAEKDITVLSTWNPGFCLRACSRYNTLDTDLRKKLRDYFRYRYRQSNAIIRVQKHLMSVMSPTLKGEVASQTNSVWISRLPFFQDCSR